MRRILDRPEEGYWDRGVWQEAGGVDNRADDEADNGARTGASGEGWSGKPGSSALLPLATPGRMHQPSGRPSSPVSPSSPPPLPQHTSSRPPRPSVRSSLSPQSLRVFAEVPALQFSPLHLASASTNSISNQGNVDDLPSQSAQAVTLIPSTPQPLTCLANIVDSDNNDQNSSTPKGHDHASLPSSGSVAPLSSLNCLPPPNHTYSTSGPDAAHVNSARTVLGELQALTSPASHNPASLATSRRRNQTYSTRVRHTYTKASPHEPRVSQTVYNSYFLLPPSVDQPQPRTRDRSMSRPALASLAAQEPAANDKHLAAAGKPTITPCDPNIKEPDDQDMSTAAGANPEQRPQHQTSQLQCPDATNLLQYQRALRSCTPVPPNIRHLQPLTVLPTKFTYALPNRTASDNVAGANIQPHRLNFTQTNQEIRFGVIIERTPVQNLPERYLLNAARPFPVSSQLVRAGHRAALFSRTFKKRRAPKGSRVCGIRDLPAHQPSGCSQEGIDTSTPVTMMIPAQVRRTPAERFRNSTPGRLALQSFRGRATGRGNPASRGVSYPPLPFASDAPPLSETYTSRASVEITANQHSSAVDDDVPCGQNSSFTQNSTGRCLFATTRSPVGCQDIQLVSQTQYDRPAFEFWSGDQEPIQDFEPEERSDTDTVEVIYAPNKDSMIINLDNGEKLRVSRDEIESFLVTEALHEMQQPMAPPTAVIDDIAQLSVDNQTPIRSTQRQPLREISISDRLSGLGMTAHLLQVADRRPSPSSKGSPDVELEEHQPVDTERCNNEPSRLNSATIFGLTQPHVSHGHPLNFFSKPPPSTPLETHQSRSTPSRTHDLPRPSTMAIRSELPRTDHPRGSQPGHDQSNNSPPLRLAKSVGANVAARKHLMSDDLTSPAFRPPTRIDVSPPQASLAERLQQSIAQAVPAYAAWCPRLQPTPPPQLGTRLRRAHSTPYPAAGGQARWTHTKG
ncbi:unnamed protein product [Cutaneotrichosporon oleaginosum]